jgi:hypothetical protein
MALGPPHQFGERPRVEVAVAGESHADPPDVERVLGAEGEGHHGADLQGPVGEPQVHLVLGRANPRQVPPDVGRGLSQLDERSVYRPVVALQGIGNRPKGGTLGLQIPVDLAGDRDRLVDRLVPCGGPVVRSSVLLRLGCPRVADMERLARLAEVDIQGFAESPASIDLGESLEVFLGFPAVVIAALAA